jgi:hypothetical protein
MRLLLQVICGSEITSLPRWKAATTTFFVLYNAVSLWIAFVPATEYGVATLLFPVPTPPKVSS